MLPLLTKYFIQYKRVCIPHVGTFELLQQPAQLNVADKSLAPPSFKTRYLNLEIISPHQFEFLDSEKEALNLYGEKLKNKIQRSGFYWKGFGKLIYSSNEIKFEAEELEIASLQTIQAKKVLRENVQHNMLVGDQEMTSQQVTDVLNKAEYKRPLFMIIGWIVFILAIIAIIILLYLKNFQTASSGIQTRFGL